METKRQEKERRFWDGFANRYDSFMKKKAWATYRLIINNIKNELFEEHTVLDAATGTGIIAIEISSNVKKVYGCDISPNMIEICLRKAEEKGISNIEFSIQDAYQLNYESEFYDIVVISNVLHILTHPENALLSIHRVLKKDGVIIAPTYCHGDSLKSRLISMIMSIAGFKAYHKWSIPSYKEFIEKNKFKIIKSVMIKDTIPLLFIVAKKS